jgi:tRNA threonylcarbamoyladenosine biosynthesis protein TsaB
MLVLGLETAGEHGCVGLVLDDRVLSEIVFHAAMKHGERLLPAVEAALGLAEIQKRDLDLIVVSVGPGSFTGLRIALSKAKGLARALEIPLVGVSAFEAYVQRAAFWPGPVWVLLPDRRDWIYAAGYEAGQVAHAPQALPLGEFLEGLQAPGRALFIGPGAELHRDALEGFGTVASSAMNRPSGVQIAQLGLERYHREGRNELYTLEPLYLQPPLASESEPPTRRQRQKRKDEAKIKL